MTSAAATPQSINTIRGIHHVAISVRDLGAAVDFYAGPMGLHAIAGDAFCAGPDGAAPAGATILEGPNAYIALHEYDDAPPAPADGVPVEGPGFTHICFQCPAPEGLYYKARAAGASAVSLGDDPVDLGGYGVCYAYLRDADATMFEIEQIDEPKFEGPIWIAHVALVSPDIDHLADFYASVLGVALVSPDIDHLADFYASVLGVAPRRRLNKVVGPRVDEVTGLPDARARAAWLWLDNMLLEIWEYVSPKTPPASAPPMAHTIGYSAFMLEVGNIEAERARLSALGVELSGEIESAPSGRCQYARDPDGNLFGLFEPSSAEVRVLATRRQIEWD